MEGGSHIVPPCINSSPEHRSAKGLSVMLLIPEDKLDHYVSDNALSEVFDTKQTIGFVFESVGAFTNIGCFHKHTFCLSCSYALPTKSTEVMLMQEQGTKMYVDAILKTHERVVQVSLGHIFSQQ